MTHYHRPGREHLEDRLDQMGVTAGAGGCSRGRAGTETGQVDGQVAKTLKTPGKVRPAPPPAMQGQYFERAVPTGLGKEGAVLESPQPHEILNAGGTEVENTVAPVPAMDTPLDPL